MTATVLDGQMPRRYEKSADESRSRKAAEARAAEYRNIGDFEYAASIYIRLSKMELDPDVQKRYRSEVLECAVGLEKLKSWTSAARTMVALSELEQDPKIAREHMIKAAEDYETGGILGYAAILWLKLCESEEDEIKKSSFRDRAIKAFDRAGLRKDAEDIRKSVRQISPPKFDLFTRGDDIT
jgi:tetratricopeptide (TPR) repeat protein